ncbi:uncharacterized protein V1518DRAFT_415608 [Limtongia smithiae]|uniref:uncharacterized protein n=1 Tax=Limtongia smithiae TaxID=1125753 RepID=UPI0034CF3C74
MRDALLAQDPSGTLLADVALPPDASLELHLAAYFLAHHPFHPFLHLPTFAPHTAPRPLLLAVLSLGALSANKTLASRLHVASKTMVNARIDTDGFSSRTAPLWVAQTVLLNTAFAAWSGDPRGLEFACSVKSFLANLACGLRHELLRRPPRPPITLVPAEDGDWIKLEAMRRTYFAIYVFFANLTALFNFPPAIANAEPAAIALPCDESVWAGTAPLTPSLPPTFRAAIDMTLRRMPTRLSPFGRRVLASALFIDSWAARSAGLLFPPCPEQLDAALTSFRHVIRPDMTSPPPASTAAKADSTLCLVRAADAVWDLARLAFDLSPLEEALRSHEITEIVHALKAAATHLVRSVAATNSGSPAPPPEFLVAQAELAADVLFPHDGDGELPPGGIEDVLVGWKCAVYLTLWLRRLELDMASAGAAAADERELAVLRRLRRVQTFELRQEPPVERPANERVSVFVAWWWARKGAQQVVGGWGIRAVLREAASVYAAVVRSE